MKREVKITCRLSGWGERVDGDAISQGEEEDNCVCDGAALNGDDPFRYLGTCTSENKISGDADLGGVAQETLERIKSSKKNV